MTQAEEALRAVHLKLGHYAEAITGTARCLARLETLVYVLDSALQACEEQRQKLPFAPVVARRAAKPRPGRRTGGISSGSFKRKPLSKPGLKRKILSNNKDDQTKKIRSLEDRLIFLTSSKTSWKGFHCFLGEWLHELIQCVTHLWPLNCQHVHMILRHSCNLNDRMYIKVYVFLHITYYKIHSHIHIHNFLFFAYIYTYLVGGLEHSCFPIYWE